MKALRDQVRDVVRRDPAADQAPIGDVALAMTAIDGNVGAVFRWGDSWTAAPGAGPVCSPAYAKRLSTPPSRSLASAR